MVSLFFGLPGSGKTTIMTQIALKWSKKRRYDNIYCNVGLAIPGVTYIDNDCIGKYCLRDCLLLIDEGTLFADSRNHKSFPKHLTQFFLLHRHFRADCIIFTQGWDSLDKRIRVITDRVYYVYKPIITGHWISKYYRIPYGIIIPDPKNGGEKLGEIIQGYCKPSLLVRLLATKVYRPKYYKYFDSFECPYLPPLPPTYHVYEKSKETRKRHKKISGFAEEREQLFNEQKESKSSTVRQDPAELVPDEPLNEPAAVTQSEQGSATSDTQPHSHRLDLSFIKL